ncbi:hypothetical protein LCI18_013855 [Fusarium solani-melongenae]|uniref:Uncharacterized protein n=1 Tax=Fusarium solani subsp. cucurbitae TaxID=2747967 RepID=A0ACD3ZNW5_FUSSC|nr:hypothetical protein LCI18_013855 [Fusarium solani-melongenae]
MAAVGPNRRLLRIAVLRCFTVPPSIAKKRGQFDSLFASWLKTAVEARNSKQPADCLVDVEISGFDVVNTAEFPTSLDDLDGIIITGSTASASDDEIWIQRLSAFLRDVYETKPAVKIFGGCFGHQLVCQTLLGRHGVHVGKNPQGWEIGVHKIHLTPEFIAHFPEQLKDMEMSFQFLHQDVVSRDGPLPEGWIDMGRSELCQSQGVLNPGRVLTYQGHPEFDQFINKGSTLSLVESGEVDENKKHSVLSLIDREDTRILAGEVVIEFFLSSRKG